MISRRSLLSAGALGGVSLVGIGTARAADRKPALRAAHVTDVHILPEREAPAGTVAMFEHMFARKEGAPALVLNTGDCVMGIDGGVTGKRAAEQVEVWKKAVAGVKVPIKSCLGNHDIWGGKDPVDDAQGELKGHGLMRKVLGMPAVYYSFDAGGWHFIALDSMGNWPNYGTLHEVQFDWLKADLAKTPRTTPVCVLSHLPILSVTSLAYGDAYRKADGCLVPKIWQHVDCWAISEIFRHHPNVKLCLSGHMHTQDRCEYRGVWYICGGAVCGAWWGGAEYGFPPCYGALDLFDDGTFNYEFVDYGWKARKWSGKQLPM